MFTEKEIAYINSQHLARLATVSKSGQPDVAPVGFRFDGKKFFITGFDITKTFKYKNVKAGNALVSLVIDDLASVLPWVARELKSTEQPKSWKEADARRLSFILSACGVGAWTVKRSKTENLSAARQAQRHNWCVTKSPGLTSTAK
jgi:PPOX class F420-dependent enzyme/OxyR family protein